MPNAADLMLRLVVALTLGAIVGLERERQERAAGLRTVTMVSLGSCLFTIIGAYGFPNTDPSRVAAQIVTGIGFLGAGTIFLRKDLVRGLTTAATIWTVAAIGMAAGTAQYFEAAFTTLLILGVLMVLKPIEKRFFKRPSEAQVSVIVPRGDGEIEELRAALAAIGAFPLAIRIHELNETDDRLEIDVGLPANRTTAELLRQLRAVQGARQVLISRDLIEDRVRAGN
ncbi:MAG: MgtC/SapB family protein [Chloroflexi bacterium]|nr:MAG: MgtC/SapB family protein [Chloroflexota bacterium]TMD50541.1 MAG: MgtC/SapB family protein [Chloroflexota bacterium]